MKKNFSDFIASLDVDKRAEIVDFASKSMDSIDDNNTDKSYVFGNKIATLSFMIALQMIGEYHEWLNSDD